MATLSPAYIAHHAVAYLSLEVFWDWPCTPRVLDPAALIVPAAMDE
jgi:hypothetical protein